MKTSEKGYGTVLTLIIAIVIIFVAGCVWTNLI